MQSDKHSINTQDTLIIFNMLSDDVMTQMLVDSKANWHFDLDTSYLHYNIVDEMLA